MLGWILLAAFLLLLLLLLLLFTYFFKFFYDNNNNNNKALVPNFLISKNNFIQKGDRSNCTMQLELLPKNYNLKLKRSTKFRKKMKGCCLGLALSSSHMEIATFFA